MNINDVLKTPDKVRLGRDTLGYYMKMLYNLGGISLDVVSEIHALFKKINSLRAQFCQLLIREVKITWW